MLLMHCWINFVKCNQGPSHGMPGGWGSKRRPVPLLDDGHLLKYLLDHVMANGSAAAFQFGAYEVLGRSQAVHPPGIRGNKDLLGMLLRLAPCGQIRHAQLAKALQKVATVHPGVNHTHLAAALWAGFKADKIGTMLAHIRRWKVDDIRKQQSRARSTIPDLEVLEELSEMLDVTTAEPWIARPEGEPMASSSKSSACTPEIKGTASRALSKTPSDVSVDDQGFPRMLGDFTCEEGRATVPTPCQGRASGPPPKKLKALDHASLACADDLLAAALAEFGDAEEEAALQAPTKEQVPLQTPAKKAQACTKAEDKWVSPVWGKLWLTQATGQSYIQFCNKDTGKKALLVSLRRNAFPNHQELLPKLASWVCAQEHVSKEDVLQQRAKLAEGQ